MQEKIKEVISQILDKKGIKNFKIILFGSRARGDFKTDSDWDFLIIVEKEVRFEDKREISREIRVNLAQLLIPCDVIIKSVNEIEYYSNFIGTVTREALKEGREI
jgi:predicted nucleotidyltransferase